MAACASAFGLNAAHAQTMTNTTSVGTIYNNEYIYDGRRNDSYSTQVSVYLPNGQTLADLTFNWAFEHSIVQTGIANIIGDNRIYTGGGRPEILLWGNPQLIDFYEEFLDSFTEVSYDEESGGTYITVQTTSGDEDDAYVYHGDRGFCYDIGVSGLTNGPAPTGYFASCDYGEELYVEPGTLNTNTHTTFITNLVERWFTNEDYLNISFYELSAVAVPIGAAHASLQTSLFDAGHNFVSKLGMEAETARGSRSIVLASLDDAPVDRSGSPVRAWGGGYGEWGEFGDESGQFERTTSGVAVGLSAISPNNFTFGAGVDYRTADIDMAPMPESAEFDVLQFGAHAGYASETWFANAVISYGMGEATTRHGDVMLGGVSTAEFDVNIATLGARAGYRFAAGGVTFPISAGADFVRTTTGDFTESGGVPLTADEYDADRSSAWFGLGAERRFDWRNRMWLDVRTRARYITTLSGEQSSLPVEFVGVDTPLEIAGFRESDIVHGSLAFVLGFSDGLALFATLEGSSNDDEETRGVSGGVRARW